METDTTRKYYEQHAADYFRQTHDRSLSDYWTMFESSISPGSLILDLGCGSGRDLKHFASAGHQAVGIDYSLPLLQLASGYSGQPTILGNLRSLPFQAASFDAAWAIASLLHQPRSALDQTLFQIASCLKPSAPFFAVMKLGNGEELDSLGRFNSYYKQDEWVNALNRAGFTVSELRVDAELRSLPDGSWQEIPWVASLALSTCSSSTSHLPRRL